MLEYLVNIEGLKGVGRVELNFQKGQRVFTLIGTNGVGKTKTLEALFQALLYSNQAIQKLQNTAFLSHALKPENWAFRMFETNKVSIQASEASSIVNLKKSTQGLHHNLPIVFLASQNRGFIKHNKNSSKAIGTFEQRRNEYFGKIIHGMKENFTSLNMDTGIEEWFVTLAKSANPYQQEDDNRNIEIQVVLKLMHEIDGRIDPEFMQISGDDRVSVKVDGQACELSHLSTGFASILKMLQAIISGYGNFTNESRLQQVKGIVLIDEIESHLHLSWQSKIIPLLKKLLPNTIFYITTHSSVVLSQLKEGEAYRLQRGEDGVVRTSLIKDPSTVSFVDMMKDVFDVDINTLKLESIGLGDQKQAKKQLLDLINGQGA